MFKSTCLLAFAAALFISAAPAHAEKYAGAGIGMFSLDAGAGKKSSAGAYVKLGSDFMPYLGAEIRIGATGGATQNNEKMQIDWLVAHFIKPYIEVADGFTLYALGGFAVNHTSLRVGTAAKLGKTNVSLSYGAGTEASIGNNLSLGVEWVRYSNKADASRRATAFQGLNINSYAGTLKYEF